MKRIEIRSTRKFSLNSMICLTGTVFWFPRTIPITVTVNKPDSVWSKFDIVKAVTTVMRETGFCKKSGIQ
jgi:hypothetical protein